MTKLFNKFLTASTMALAAFCSFACSDKIAGTAEEQNQIANGEKSSSSSEGETANGVIPDSSNSNTSPAPSVDVSSSSRYDEGFTPIYIDPSSSSNTAGEGNKGNDPDVVGNPDTVPAYTLDSYLKYYGITEVTYDDNVLGYNVTFKSCDASQETCFESPSIAKLRELGLHKLTAENASELGVLFLRTALNMGNKLYENNGAVSRTQDGCPLYVLNVIDTSPAVHVLTKISKDTIAITEIHDNCDYEPRPFDMHVGFLFEYCGELSESPKIDITFKLNESMKCGTVDYDEYISKKLK